MVTTTSSRLDISTLDSPDMELSLLRLAWCEILRLPGLVGEYRGHVTSCPPITAHLLGRLSTLPPPDSWVRTPGVDRDRGSDMARRGAGSRGLQLTRCGSTRDQGLVFTGGRDQHQEGSSGVQGGARPHTRKWRAGAGSGPGAGASWPPSAAHLLSPGRGGRGGGGCIKHVWPGEKETRYDGRVSSCLLLSPPTSSMSPGGHWAHCPGPGGHMCRWMVE